MAGNSLEIKKKRSVICFVGIDGSGKSTIIHTACKDLDDKSISYKNIHMFHQPILLLPAKWFARLIFLKKKRQYDGDYKGYRKQKHISSQRNPILAKIYALMWLVDYSMQTFWKYFLLFKLKKNGLIILDRYIYDTAINVVLSLNLPYIDLIKMIDFWHGWFPVPDMVFWVDVPVDLAYGRKNDIPSIEYLVERKMLYEKLVKRFNFVRLDGSLPIEKITGQIKGYLKVIGSS